MKYEDFLTIEESKVENYNWDLFWRHPDMPKMGFSILEGFEQIQKHEPTIYGTEDKFLITLKSGQTFTVIINYWNPAKTKDTVKYGEVATSKDDPVVSEIFKQLKDALNPTDYLCLVQFKDSVGRHNSTGEVGGASAIELFTALKDSVMTSLMDNDFKNCRGIVMRVDENEERRVKLYENMLKKYYGNVFTTTFIDKSSEYKHGQILVYAIR